MLYDTLETPSRDPFRDPETVLLRTGPEWVHEYRLDGYRACMQIAPDGTTVLTGPDGYKLPPSLTTTAHDAAGHVHDRSPVLLPLELRDRWLDPHLIDPTPSTPDSTRCRTEAADFPGQHRG